MQAISDVNIFAIADGKMGAFGAIDYSSNDELAKKLALVDTEGKPLAALTEEKQSAATRNMLAVMKPIFANMLGEFGKNISFFVYEGKAKNGSRRIDPTKQGLLVAKLNSEEFRWRLPLGSLLPERICPKCGEILPGNYNVCPFDVTPLK